MGLMNGAPLVEMVRSSGGTTGRRLRAPRRRVGVVAFPLMKKTNVVIPRFLYPFRYFSWKTAESAEFPVTIGPWKKSYPAAGTAVP